MTIPHHQYNREFHAASEDSLSLLARRIQPGTTILELGSATGYFTRHLHDELKCTVDAVELDAQMAEQARPWCRRLVVGNLERLNLAEQFPDMHYDTILFADVLEHLRDPLVALQQAVSLLTEQGQILISVPNVSYAGLIAGLLQGEFIYRDEGLLDRTHLRFFTRSSLEALLHEAGLHVWDWQAVERPLWDSEFRIRLETLPSAWVETLLGQPHALCYQWVAVARTTMPPQTPLLPVMGGHDRFPVRLFWRAAPEDFEFFRSQLAWGKVGLSGQTLAFTLPAGRYEQLRLSLADRPGYVRLHTIHLYDLAGTLLWQWRAGDELNTADSGGMHGAIRDGNYHAILHDTQSWFNLPIPPHLPEAGLRLEVKLDWPVSADYAALLPLVRDEIDSLHGELDAVRQTVGERDALLELRTDQIAERERLIAERDELLKLRNAQIAERDALLELRTDQIAESKRLVNERDELLDQRNMQITLLEQQLVYRAGLAWWLKSPLRLAKRAIRGAT